MKKIFLSLLSSVFLLAACGGGATITDANALQLVSAEPSSSLNHLIEMGFTNATIFGNTLEGLTQFDAEVGVKGAFAESWEISEDGKTYTFHLRDAQWENGDPVTAHDFVFAWQTKLAMPEAPYRHYYEVIVNAAEINKGKLPVSELGVEAPDANTFIVHLTKPTNYFIQMTQLYFFGPLNQKFYEEVTPEAYGTSDETFLSNGAYRIAEYAPEVQWKYEKNPNYWDTKNVAVNEVSVRVVEEPSTREMLWGDNEADVFDITSDFIDKYETDANLQTQLRPKISYIYLSNETAIKNEALGNQNFRAAVAHAIDKTIITEGVLRDGSVPADYFVTADTIKLDGVDFREMSPYFKQPIFDKSKALEYLDAAKAELSGAPMVITLALSDVGMNKKIYENVKAQIEENLPGVTVELQTIPGNLFWAQMMEKTTPSAAVSWQPGYADVEAFFPPFSSDQSQNFSNWENAEFASLFAKAESAEKANKPRERLEDYVELERILLEDYTIIPIYQEGITYLTSEKLIEYRLNPVPPHYAYKNYVVKA